MSGANRSAVTARRVQAPIEGTADADGSEDPMLCERIVVAPGIAVCRAEGRCDRPTTFHAPDHAGARLHLQFLARGDCVFHDRAQERPLRSYAATLIPASGRQAAWTAMATEHLSVLSIDVCQTRLAGWFEDAPFDWKDRLANPSAMDTRANQAIADLSFELRDRRPHRLALEARVLRIIDLGLDQTIQEAGASPSRSEERASTARDMIMSHAEPTTSIEDLSRALQLSPRRLDIQYRRAFGLSLHQAMIQARLDRAYRAVRETSRPIKQIAWEAGYAHATSFTHAFRRRFGQAPNTLRDG